MTEPYISSSLSRLQDWWTEMGLAPDLPPPPAKSTARATTRSAKAPATAKSTARAEPTISAPTPCQAGSLDELHKAIEAMTDHPLRAGTRNTVFADGDVNSKLMVIGEAPGADEDAQGLPFVGRAGKLLDKMFLAINRDRSNGFYITNILPWRPAGNRDPTPEEIAFFMPFLIRHIELAAPVLLVTAGRFSTHTLLHSKEPISRLRGKISQYSHDGFGPIPCIPIMHPAYLLRRPNDKKRAWRDMLAIAAAARQAGIEEKK